MRVFRLDAPFEKGHGWAAGDVAPPHATNGSSSPAPSGLAASLATRPDGSAEGAAEGGKNPGVRHVLRELCRLDSHRTPVWRVGFDDDGVVMGSVGDDGRLVCFRQMPSGVWAKSSELGMVKARMVAP